MFEYTHSIEDTIFLILEHVNLIVLHEMHDFLAALHWSISGLILYFIIILIIYRACLYLNTYVASDS
jgi:hypothetical protein